MFNFFQGFNVGFCCSNFSFIMDWYHNFSCSIFFGLLFFVSWLIFFLVMNNFFFSSLLLYYPLGEFFCSLIPIWVLFFQVFPSLMLLYFYGLMNFDSIFSIKITGHQWYWSYLWGGFLKSFDSYMIPMEDFFLGYYSLMEVDNHCLVSYDINYLFCVNSADVIHSWSLFHFFLKMDAMSGIMTIFNFLFSVVGVFYGECSEICGANHSFMPIILEVVPFESYMNWCIKELG